MPETNEAPKPTPTTGETARLIIRYVLMGIGAMLAQRGLVSADFWQGNIELITGIILTAGPPVWAYFERLIAARKTAEKSANSLTEADVVRLIRIATQQPEHASVAQVQEIFNERQERHDAPTLELTGVPQAPITPNVVKETK